MSSMGDENGLEPVVGLLTRIVERLAEERALEIEQTRL